MSTSKVFDEEIGVEEQVVRGTAGVDELRLGAAVGADDADPGLDLTMLMHDIGTSFAFSWLISRLAGTLPRLVGADDGGVEKVELEKLENGDCLC